ncbi:alpha/beta fold hydrolase [Nocardia sp. NPDC101769]|uniref:alpha/beta fold hydrolase n=1 Tax=Nocardia sp. NPDC101769 TaxID=3364333 RepID=UPI00381EECBB
MRTFDFPKYCRVFERAGIAGVAGIARQVQAIQLSGDRTESLSAIVALTLAIHGDRDLIVGPSGGRATADAVPGAQLVTIPGVATSREHRNYQFRRCI